MNAHDDFTCSALDGHCITCSDAVTMVQLAEYSQSGDLGVCVDERGTRVDVLLGLIEDPRVGDTLLVHAGTALLRVDPPQVASE